MVYDAARVGQNCEFCGSPALVAYQEIKSPIRPEGVLPFRIDRNRVRDDIRRWWRSKWLAPGRLAKAALVDTVHSLYIPYWTFDAHAHCPWDAEAGHYYYVNVEGRDSKGNRVVRQERRVRWEAASGVVEHTFDDEPVPGTTGVPIESAAAGRAVSDERGRSVRHRLSVGPRGRALPGGADRGGRRFGAADARHARAAVRAPGAGRHASQPARSTRRSRARPSSTCSCRSGCSSTRSGAEAFQVVVNGYTGRIAGRYPYSPWKIAFLVVLAILAVMVFALASEG